MPSAPSGPETAQRLARALGDAYQVRRLVGHGGFAEVYEAWDVELERRLAVKVLRPDIAWTAGMLERFKHETRAIAQLQHPNILPIHFVGEGEGLVYYAMPYVEGQSLSDLLRNFGPLTPKRALDVAIPVLQALQHAHDNGLVHRDIKPDNIMLDMPSGRPLLMDFGIAKRLDADGTITQTGFVVGTPYYMSPEQALGQRDLDGRSDIYAFGAVLFQMVTGDPPFDGDSSQEIVGKHLADPPPEASEVNERVPEWLSQVIIRSLEKKPSDRFGTAKLMAGALEAGGGTTQPPAEEVDTTAATELVESGQRHSAPTEAIDPQVDTAAATRRGNVRVQRLALLSLPIVVLVLVALWWFTRPRLVFENVLVAPVTVSLGAERHTVEPGERISLSLSRGGLTDVMWNLERTTDSTGNPLGVEVFGVISIAETRGSMRGSSDATLEDRAFFAPLITNATGRPLTVIVNAGTPAAMPCNCTVPPDTTRMHVGYYRLFSNSTVRVEDAEGRSATFADIAGEVNRRSGALGLRFEAKDLR
jgi:hypothetical protein